MNEEFIPYEQALALKELGFNEPCFGLYSDEELDYRVPNDVPFPKNSEYDDSRFVTAPLYQQAFKWFREKYDIHGNVAGRYLYEITGVKSNQGMFSKEFETYEEAQLACLKKLIEIVNGRTN